MLNSKLTPKNDEELDHYVTYRKILEIQAHLELVSNTEYLIELLSQSGCDELDKDEPNIISGIMEELIRVNLT